MFGVYCGADNTLYPTGSVPFYGTCAVKGRNRRTSDLDGIRRTTCLDDVIADDSMLCSRIRNTHLGAVDSKHRALALLLSHRIRAYANTPIYNQYYVNDDRFNVAQLPIDVWSAICSHLDSENLFSLLKAAPYHNVRTAVCFRAGECIQSWRSFNWEVDPVEQMFNFDARRYWHELYLFLHYGCNAIPSWWIRIVNEKFSMPVVPLEWCQPTHSQIQWCESILALPVARVLLGIIDSGAHLQDFPACHWIPS
jgi:hypothetical protein